MAPVDPSVATPLRRGTSVILTALAVFGGVVLLLGLGLLILGIFSVRRFATRSKEADATFALGQLARGVARCAEKEAGAFSANLPGTSRGLPASTPPVPARFADVLGKKKYQSVPEDWAPEAYACAAFQIDQPQAIQIEWQRLSATAGVVRVRVDADGDGKLDLTAELDVTCAGFPDKAELTCTTSPSPRMLR